MTTTNEAALKLAREIADKIGHGSSMSQPRWQQGYDCALAAILEVTERAAGFIETEEVAPGKYGIDLRKFNGLGDWLKAGRAAALRNMEHLV